MDSQEVLNSIYGGLCSGVKVRRKEMRTINLLQLKKESARTSLTMIALI